MWFNKIYLFLSAIVQQPISHKKSYLINSVKYKIKYIAILLDLLIVLLNSFMRIDSESLLTKQSFYSV